MKKENFERLLERLEIKSEKVTVYKNNGVEINGYTLIFDTKVRPTIYDSMIENSDEMELVRIIMEEKTKAETEPMDIMIDKIMTREYVKENVYIGIRNIEANVNDVTTTSRVNEYCTDLEEYLYIRLKKEDCERLGDISAEATIKINENLLNIINSTEKEVWKWAEENMIYDLEIKTIQETLSELMPYETEETIPDCGMFVISNKCKTFGAGQIVNMNLIKKYLEKKGVERFAILPSSIHEILAVRINEHNMAELNDMVKEITINQVEPKERLSEHAYGIFTI